MWRPRHQATGVVDGPAMPLAALKVVPLIACYAKASKKNRQHRGSSTDAAGWIIAYQENHRGKAGGDRSPVHQ
jgi:hypothetical protein